MMTPRLLLFVLLTASLPSVSNSKTIDQLKDQLAEDDEMNPGVDVAKNKENGNTDVKLKRTVATESSSPRTRKPNDENLLSPTTLRSLGTASEETTSQSSTESGSPKTSISMPGKKGPSNLIMAPNISSPLGPTKKNNGKAPNANIHLTPKKAESSGSIPDQLEENSSTETPDLTVTTKQTTNDQPDTATGPSLNVVSAEDVQPKSPTTMNIERIDPAIAIPESAVTGTSLEPSEKTSKEPETEKNKLPYSTSVSITSEGSEEASTAVELPSSTPIIITTISDVKASTTQQTKNQNVTESSKEPDSVEEGLDEINEQADAVKEKYEETVMAQNELIQKLVNENDMAKGGVPGKIPSNNAKAEGK